MRMAIRTMKNPKIVAKTLPLTLNLRQGWAKDSQRIEQTQDDALGWPEFGNANDKALRFGLTLTTP